MYFVLLSLAQLVRDRERINNNVVDKAMDNRDNGVLDSG